MIALTLNDEDEIREGLENDPKKKKMTWKKNTSDSSEVDMVLGITSVERYYKLVIKNSVRLVEVDTNVPY